jgi:hypothetical protein
MRSSAWSRATNNDVTPFFPATFAPDLQSFVPS